METFATRLKRLRGRLVSQEELAKRSGVTVAAISKLERGEHQPSRMTILKIAAALNIPPEHLWSGADTVTIELPRAAYESIAERASSEGTLDVTAFIIRLCVKKKMVFDDFDNPPSQKRFNSQTPPPAPAGKPAAATPAPAKRPSAPTPD